MIQNKSSKYTSLRSILIIWFIFFSIIPLALVSWYSVIKFQKAIESEQLQRLKANGREIGVILADYYSQLVKNRDVYASSPQFTYNLSIADLSALKVISNEWLNSNIVSSLAIYSRDGHRLSFTEKKNINSSIVNQQTTNEKIILNKKYLAHLSDQPDLGIINKDLEGEIELVLFSKVISSAGKVIGYIEQKIKIRENFLSQVKNKLKLELILMNDTQQIVASTLNLESNGLKKLLENKENPHDSDSVLEVKSKNNPYIFLMYPVSWGKSALSLAIGTSKKESLMVMNNVNVAFLGVISMVILFLIVTIFISTSLLLRPINELIDGLRAFEKTDSPVQLAVKNKTEIGLLTETFNHMSYKVFQARNDLKSKIKELETVNNDLKIAQSKLVQSAKMTSLGQLVAGVAHELNNPIAFIYSNTSHLKDYSEKLFKIIEEIEKHPGQSEKIKQDNEFDYIKKDLPLLIKSCQDGAQRTRDIVIGLRNFSRLEESLLKEIDIRESIDTTLELLNGEIKNRIKIHRQYENIPPMLCYASQINQVLMNLLSNAVHAISGNGQIWISVALSKLANQAVDQVLISIQDTGSGMSPEIMDKIFEPFFTTKDVGQGTGLGLSISYGIIQNHAGDIQVKSEKGVGTEFIITVPLQQSSQNKTKAKD